MSLLRIIYPSLELHTLLPGKVFLIIMIPSHLFDYQVAFQIPIKSLQSLLPPESTAKESPSVFLLGSGAIAKQRTAAYRCYTGVGASV